MPTGPELNKKKRNQQKLPLRKSQISSSQPPSKMSQPPSVLSKSQTQEQSKPTMLCRIFSSNRQSGAIPRNSVTSTPLFCSKGVYCNFLHSLPFSEEVERRLLLERGIISANILSKIPAAEF